MGKGSSRRLPAVAPSRAVSTDWLLEEIVRPSGAVDRLIGTPDGPRFVRAVSLAPSRNWPSSADRARVFLLNQRVAEHGVYGGGRDLEALLAGGTCCGEICWHRDVAARLARRTDLHAEAERLVTSTPLGCHVRATSAAPAGDPAAPGAAAERADVWVAVIAAYTDPFEERHGGPLSTLTTVRTWHSRRGIAFARVPFARRMVAGGRSCYDCVDAAHAAAPMCIHHHLFMSVLPTASLPNDLEMLLRTAAYTIERSGSQVVLNIEHDGVRAAYSIVRSARGDLSLWTRDMSIPVVEIYAGARTACTTCRARVPDATPEHCAEARLLRTVNEILGSS